MKYLLFLTHVYPFSPPGEQFIHSEIPFLANEFDTIHIIPVSRSANTTHIREILSDNVQVHRLIRGKKIIEILTGFFFNAIWKKEFYLDIIKLITNRLLINKSALFLFFEYHTNAYIIQKLVTKKCKEFNFNKNDSITIYSYWLNSIAYAACLIQLYFHKNGFFSINTISRAHGSADIYISDNIKLFKPCINCFNKYLDQVFVISQNGKKALENIGLKSEKINIHYLGIVDHGFNKVENERNAFLVVSCSYISKTKRIDLITSALSKITDTKIIWRHFGDGDLYSEIELFCKENLSENIDWQLMGNTDNEDILQFYKENSPDLIINTSSIEGIPVSLMEAASCGIPIIATDVGGSSEICINNYNGILLDKNITGSNIAILIKKMIHMIPEQKSRMKLNSRELFESKFSSNKNFSSFSKAISHLKYK